MPSPMPSRSSRRGRAHPHTGGGGWGDPLDRPIDEVVRDVLWRKVSVEGARDDYGVM